MVASGKGPAASALSDMDHWVSAAYSTMSVFSQTHFVPRQPPPPPPPPAPKSRSSSSTVVKDKSLSTCASIPSWGGVPSIPSVPVPALHFRRDPEEEEEEYEAIMADESSARSRRTTPRVYDGAKILTSKLPVAPQPTSIRYSLPKGQMLRCSEALLNAAEKFDDGHRKLTKEAYAGLTELYRDGGEHVPGRTARFLRMVDDLKQHKFLEPMTKVKIVGERAKKPASTVKREKAAKQFKLQESSWKVRSGWSDSRNFDETTECYEKAFILDWSRALRAHKLAAYITYNDEEGDSDDEAEAEAVIAANGIDSGITANGGDHEVAEVGKVMWKHHMLIYRIFDSYASADPKRGISSIGYNAFKDFVQDCDLDVPGSKHCDSADFDRIFIQVNTKEIEGTGKRGGLGKFELTEENAGRHGMGVTTFKADVDQRGLCRYEWFNVLVRIGIIKYVLTKEVPDVSQAMDKLLTEIAPKLDSWITMDQGKFRNEICYNPLCDEVLTEHMESLKIIFAFSADSEADHKAGREKFRSVLSVYEWIELLRDLQLLDSNFTVRDATVIFVLSRMRVINEQGKNAVLKIENLSLEDFYEALIRIAMIKALPTDDEIAEAGCLDAGDFIWRLRDSKEEDDWLRDYYDIHGCDMAKPALRQPPHRSLHHLLILMMRTIEQIGAGDAPSKTDLKVTKKEMTKFVGRADAARGKS